MWCHVTESDCVWYIQFQDGLTANTHAVSAPQLYFISITDGYTEAKEDVTQEIEQRVQQATQAGADHCALCSFSCVTSTLASV